MAKQMVKMFILLLITAGVLSIQPKEVSQLYKIINLKNSIVTIE